MPTDPTFLTSWTAWDQLTDHLDATGVPWPPVACTLDVRAHEAALAAGVIARRPGSPYYAARWRVTDYEARRRMSAARAVDPDEGTTTPSAGAALPGDSSPHDGQQPHAPAVETKDGRQRRDSTAPPRLFPDRPIDSEAVVAPISTELQSLVDHTQRDQRGVQGGAGAAPVEPRPGERVQGEDRLGDEARLFLSIWRRWGPAGAGREGLRPDHPARQWSGRADEALAWFVSEIMGSPDLRGLDILAGLREWADYLDDKARLWGQPGTANRGRFPSRWKQALRRWFDNRLAWGRDNSSRPGYTSTPAPRGPTHAPPAAPRGTWGGARQPAKVDPRRPDDHDFDDWTR